MNRPPRNYAPGSSGYPPGKGYVDQAERERRVTVRLARQSLLSRPRAPHLSVILNVAVLHRLVGGADVMAEQFKYLLDVTQRGNVSVRVLPFAAGMAASTPFSLLDFPADPVGEVLEPPLAYVDTLTGALYLNKPDESSAYRLIWEDLDDRAIDEAASKKMITTALEELSGD